MHGTLTSPDGMPVPRRLTLPERVARSGTREASITLSVHEAGREPAVVL